MNNNSLGFLKNYQINNNRIFLFFTNGKCLVVFLSENSGRIIKRRKINTVFGVWHVGIFLGTTSTGEKIIVHNHFKAGRPAIATLAQFEQGRRFSWDNRYCNEPWHQIIISALNLTLRGNSYHAVNYNCQTFVNLCCIRQAKSEAVENSLKGIAAAATFLFAIGLVSALARS